MHFSEFLRQIPQRNIRILGFRNKNIQTMFPLKYRWRNFLFSFHMSRNNSKVNGEKIDW